MAFVNEHHRVAEIGDGRRFERRGDAVGPHANRRSILDVNAFRSVVKRRARTNSEYFDSVEGQSMRRQLEQRRLAATNGGAHEDVACVQSGGVDSVGQATQVRLRRRIPVDSETDWAARGHRRARPCEGQSSQQAGEGFGKSPWNGAKVNVRRRGDRGIHRPAHAKQDPCGLHHGGGGGGGTCNPTQLEATDFPKPREGGCGAARTMVTSRRSLAPTREQCAPYMTTWLFRLLNGARPVMRLSDAGTTSAIARFENVVIVCCGLTS